MKDVECPQIRLSHDFKTVLGSTREECFKVEKIGRV